MSVCQLATMLMSITQHSPAIAIMSAAQSMLMEKGVVSHSIVLAFQSETSVGCTEGTDAAGVLPTWCRRGPTAGTRRSLR